MKKFILLYLSLFLFLLFAFYYNMQFAQYILFGFIIFQFVISLGTFLLDHEDLKQIYQPSNNVPLFYTFTFDLIFIGILFYFNQTIFGCLWFIQSFLINNTFIKAESLFNKNKQI